MENLHNHRGITNSNSCPPHGFTDIFRRELGLSHPNSFARRFSASEVLVKSLDLYGKLDGHEGCVNAVEFNSTGDLLVSGSDDRQVMFWNWASKTRLFAYPSGHTDNIFQTKIIPFTDDCRIVTSAGDGQVRLGLLWEDGRVDTTMLGKHHGCVYKLAVEPGSAHIFYSSGEDGFIQHFDLRSNSATKLFCCSSSIGNNKQTLSKVGLNSIVIDPRNPYYFAIGGSDEYARVYDIRKCQWGSARNSDRPVNTFCPCHLIGSNNVHITGLAYSSFSELLVSYNDELIYLFEKNVHSDSSPSSATSEDPKNIHEAQVYSGHRNAQTIKGVNFFGPNDEYIMSGSDCGHIFIWKKKEAKLVRLMVGDQHVVNQLEAHPHIPILATCGIEKNVKIWAPLGNDIPPLPANVKEIMETNRQGREDRSRVTLTPDVIMHVLRLQRRQTLAYIERRHNRADIVSDEEDAEGYLLGFSDGDASSEEDSPGNSRDCNIS
ncbi:DDB1- and CUL4-associated factor 8-like [Glycine soja]|uniref:DDB1-and CUL4-associated factor 8 isoform A n=1 Tax=Glycine soja TaxID=3848 RepID=A0A445GP22_GLYSO|nr:DDB1- and CUL4-associated factor 8-like [Glycine soja]KHN33442.1 DDB1- and CUL4-associated factor 8 [Glycine soja]RZB63045.1 DDB1- and CUL4-associated factor 8 isoform A [Glycine soja]